MPHYSLITLLSLCFCWSCTPSGAQNQPTDQQALPSRSKIVNLSWQADTCLVAYPSGLAAKAYADALQVLTQKTNRRGPAIRLIPDDQLTDSLLTHYPLLLLSTGERALPILPLPDLHLDQKTLKLGDEYEIGAGQLAVLSYLPGIGGQAVHLIYSPNDSLLQNTVQALLIPQWPRFLWRSWGYQVYEGESLLIQGYYNDSNWKMDRQLHFDFRQHATLVDSIEGLSIKSWSDKTIAATPILKDFKTVRQDILAQWGATTLPDVLIYLYPSVENKALRTQEMAISHCDLTSNQVFLVENEHFRAHEWGEQYRPLLRASLGEPQYELLEMGLALNYRATIRGRNWRNYARRLALADALVTPENQAADGWREYRPLVGQISAAAWVDFLLASVDTAVFRQYYLTGSLPGQFSSWVSAWKSWVVQNYTSTDEPSSKLPKQRLNGFTFAHEGYRVYNGYGGSQADASLEALRQLGTNAVAIVPYSYMHDPTRATAIPVMRDAGTENDAAVLHAHFEAQALNQFTLLKPQLWINGAWPGDVTFDTEEEWQDFFNYYREWALHYALLAEIFGFDAYCIGTELRHTTLQQPEAWRALIQDIRQIYGGFITYAANWGEECEQLPFWAELDFIGVNCYYPLHSDSTATDAELAQGAAAIMKRLHSLHEQYQRPLWLTEVGYRSATSSWIMPHEEAGARAIDNAAQARCYAALLSAMEEERDWLHGMFWWKWPCHLDHDESEGRGYMPLGKPAEKVIRRYF